MICCMVRSLCMERMDLKRVMQKAGRSTRFVQRYQCASAVMAEIERSGWVWEVLRSEELDDGLNVLGGLMGRRDLPRMAARFLTWVMWVDLHFSKYVTCNTSSIGYKKVLCQKWLHPQINLRNAGLKVNQISLLSDFPEPSICYYCCRS